MPFQTKVAEVGNLTLDTNAYVTNWGYGTIINIKKNPEYNKDSSKGVLKTPKWSAGAECLKDGKHGIEMVNYNFPLISSSTPMIIGLF